MHVLHDQVVNSFLVGRKISLYISHFWRFTVLVALISYCSKIVESFMDVALVCFSSSISTVYGEASLVDKSISL